MIYSEFGSINFTIPTLIYDLGNISLWPDASLLVCHGGALFYINIYICTSASALNRPQIYFKYFQYFDSFWFDKICLSVLLGSFYAISTLFQLYHGDSLLYS